MESHLHTKLPIPKGEARRGAFSYQKPTWGNPYHQSAEHVPSGWIEIEKKSMLVVHSCEALDACRRRDVSPSPH